MDKYLWLFSIIGSIGVLFYVGTKSISSAMGSYKNRNLEKPTVGPPSMACGVCGGKWGPWSRVVEEVKAYDPHYPNRGSFTNRSQARQCTDCGIGERRVL